MSLWNQMSLVKAIPQMCYKKAIAILGIAFFVASTVFITTVFAEQNNISSIENDNVIVYNDREKILKITEISFRDDFASMSVLIENMQSGAEFRIEHDLDISDTINEYIEVTATDGMGNLSETVSIKNPFYTPEPEPEPVQGSLSVIGSQNDENEIESVFVNDKPIEETDTSGTFNTNGWATVVDNAVTNDKDFFIVRSETGHEFYIIIDREGGRENVYFLNAVTEWDLLGLAEKYEVPNNLDPSTTRPANTADADNTTVPPTPQEPIENNKKNESTDGANNTTGQQTNQQSNTIFGMVIIILFAVGVGAYFYFFKIRKKDSYANTNADDGYLEDNYGESDEDEETTENIKYDDEDFDEEDEAVESSMAEIDENEFVSVKNEFDSVIETDNTDKDKDCDSRAAPEETEEISDCIDDDVDSDYGENDVSDDYGGEVDEDDVLSMEGGDEDEEEDETI